MVKKKGKKKSKKSKSPEPSELIAPTGEGFAGVAAAAKMAKKLTKKKATRAQRALEQLNKLVEAYKLDKTKYEQFVNRIDKWFGENSVKIMGCFQRFDTDNLGELTYEQFKAGMLDFDCPCNMIEMHLLTTLFDEDGNGTIDFSEFDKGVRYFREVESAATGGTDQDVAETVQLIGPWEPKWVKLHFIFVTFEEQEKHPAHFIESVPLSSSVCQLIMLIRERTQLACSDIAIFQNNSRSAEALLEEGKTLKDYDFRGGPSYDPRDQAVYYDYRAEQSECPILLCDHYFSGLKKKTKKK